MLTSLQAGRLTSKVVDIYNANSGRWSAASLSEARKHVAATSLPSQGLALFAGGLTGVICCKLFECGMRLASATDNCWVEQDWVQALSWTFSKRAVKAGKLLH